jgi:hypothetical protein
MVPGIFSGTLVIGFLKISDYHIYCKGILQKNKKDLHSVGAGEKIIE